MKYGQGILADVMSASKKSNLPVMPKIYISE